MKDAVLIQTCDNVANAEMIALYFGRHVEYCVKHDFDYWTHSGRMRMCDDQPWVRFALAIEAFLTGYKYVVYLDTDAFIYDLDADLREACIKPINLVRYTVPTSHLNTGVIYFNNDRQIAKAVCQFLLQERRYFMEYYPSLRGWFDQGHVNLIYNNPGNAEHFGEVDIKYNWDTHYSDPCEHPIVKAWHGVLEPERTEEMRKE